MFHFREAQSHDRSFLLEAIVSAERLPVTGDVTMYEVLLGISRDDLRGFLSFALDHNSQGHQLALRSFQILCEAELPVACCAAWIESGGTQPSGILSALLMAEYFGRDYWLSRRQQFKTVSAASPRRTSGALQLETFFVLPSHRGRGLTGSLIRAIENSALEGAAAPPITAQITLLSENTTALSAYERAGFVETWRTQDISAEFTDLTGSLGYRQLARNLP